MHSPSFIHYKISEKRPCCLSKKHSKITHFQRQIGIISMKAFGFLKLLSKMLSLNLLPDNFTLTLLMPAQDSFSHSSFCWKNFVQEETK